MKMNVKDMVHDGFQLRLLANEGLRLVLCVWLDEGMQ